MYAWAIEVSLEFVSIIKNGLAFCLQLYVYRGCKFLVLCNLDDSKLPFQLHKNENNTDIWLYQIYLPKLHENI